MQKKVKWSGILVLELAAGGEQRTQIRSARGGKELVPVCRNWTTEGLAGQKENFKIRPLLQGEAA